MPPRADALIIPSARRGAGSTKRWLQAWPGAALIGVANGAVREGTYGRWLGEETANQVSVATLIGGLAAYFWVLERRWPIPSRRTAYEIGAAWAAMTVAFEFGFGRLQGESWREMLAAYNLGRGRTWPLVVAWIAAGPAAVRRIGSSE